MAPSEEQLKGAWSHEEDLRLAELQARGPVVVRARGVEAAGGNVVVSAAASHVDSARQEAAALEMRRQVLYVRRLPPRGRTGSIRA